MAGHRPGFVDAAAAGLLTACVWLAGFEAEGVLGSKPRKGPRSTQSSALPLLDTFSSVLNSTVDPTAPAAAEDPLTDLDGVSPRQPRWRRVTATVLAWVGLVSIVVTLLLNAVTMSMSGVHSLELVTYIIYGFCTPTLYVWARRLHADGHLPLHLSVVSSDGAAASVHAVHVFPTRVRVAAASLVLLLLCSWTFLVVRTVQTSFAAAAATGLSMSTPVPVTLVFVHVRLPMTWIMAMVMVAAVLYVLGDMLPVCGVMCLFAARCWQQKLRVAHATRPLSAQSWKRQRGATGPAPDSDDATAGVANVHECARAVLRLQYRMARTVIDPLSNLTLFVAFSTFTAVAIKLASLAVSGVAEDVSNAHLQGEAAAAARENLIYLGLMVLFYGATRFLEALVFLVAAAMVTQAWLNATVTLTAACAAAAADARDPGPRDDPVDLHAVGLFLQALRDRQQLGFSALGFELTNGTIFSILTAMGTAAVALSHAGALQSSPTNVVIRNGTVTE